MHVEVVLIESWGSIYAALSVHGLKKIKGSGHLYAEFAKVEMHSSRTTDY